MGVILYVNGICLPKMSDIRLLSQLSQVSYVLSVTEWVKYLVRRTTAAQCELGFPHLALDGVD